jgi:hypothetical protein
LGTEIMESEHSEGLAVPLVRSRGPRYESAVTRFASSIHRAPDL